MDSQDITDVKQMARKCLSPDSMLVRLLELEPDALSKDEAIIKLQLYRKILRSTGVARN